MSDIRFSQLVLNSNPSARMTNMPNLPFGEGNPTGTAYLSCTFTTTYVNGVKSTSMDSCSEDNGTGGGMGDGSTAVPTTNK